MVIGHATWSYSTTSSFIIVVAKWLLQKVIVVVLTQNKAFPSLQMGMSSESIYLEDCLEEVHVY
jgi:hypothetical protein